ncbi:MAG: LysM peptidoglycan-binding domain-containing protein [Firmicutes bacterium]|nr:LysM peptidoglycan-binding domain-containing protein [Bacillota bacterium]MDY5335687.1 LysM peptidoglycan-binding domain-containing protein [Bacilli bacterium]
MNNNEDRAVRKVIIDPGHGGTDSGATGNNLLEKDYNLLISKYMYDRFKELGVPVAITRDSDTTLSPTDRVNTILNKFGNSSDVILISNHVNSGGGEGAEVIYALRNRDTLARRILENIGTTGQTTRKYYQRRLPSDTSKDYYFIHRNTGNLEPLIVEYGFIDDTKDVEFLKENYKELAEAVISAVANYIGVPYTPPEGITTNTYVVQKGDSLYSIANKLGTTVSELKKENNLTTNTLQIGEVLRIPTKEIYEGEENVYIVQKGDTLYSVAMANNTTVDELKRINNLTSNILSTGQLLKIPSALLPESTYIVKKGDSLYSIANKYNTTVDELKRINNLTSNILSIGQVLKLPSDKVSDVEKEENTISYTVQKGDSLYSIARKYSTTIDKIKDLNNLTTNLLSIGQVLLIPTDTNLETTYTVQKGDSLYSIAKKYDTTVDRLKQLNNLKSNLLSIGQILIVR